MREVIGPLGDRPSVREHPGVTEDALARPSEADDEHRVGADS